MIDFLVKWQNSLGYPLVFALLCALSAVNGMDIYVPIMRVMCVCVVFSAFFADDPKVFFPPLISAYYSLGCDYSAPPVGSETDVFDSFHPHGLQQTIIIFAVMAAVVLIRFIADGTLARAFAKRGIAFRGLVLLSVALVLNGALAEPYNVKDLAFGIFSAFGLIFFYVLGLAVADRSHTPVKYACFTVFCTSWAVVFELAARVLGTYSAGKLFIFGSAGQLIGIDRDVLTLSWGLVTIISAVIVLGIPAAMYLARSEKCPALYYFSAVAFYCAAIAVDSRGAILIGGIALLICIVVCCIGGKNKTRCRILTAVLAVLIALAAAVTVYTFGSPANFINRALQFLRFGDDMSSSGRFILWQNGIEDFLSQPIFGVGFSNGAYENSSIPIRYDNIYSYMYHNVFIQFLAAAGIVGLILFIYHLKDLLELFVRRRNGQKTLVLMVPIMIVALSFFDNFFFYLNFQIFYGLFLAFAEIELEQARKNRLSELKPLCVGKKPRVVFTYVEAGKGHIVPTRAVSNAFRAKYGDKAEVVDSAFYTETGSASLESLEILFSKTVKIQNRTRIMSVLCKIGNSFFGDACATNWLMLASPQGLCSRKEALRHLRELDADIIFTAHWATACYANAVDAPRPYTVCLCPDTYSNGMFNIDVNDFLMPTREGAAALSSRRMYAGGNVSYVPFPIREEAFALRGKRDELRRKLGIADDEFAVTLSDGGYGMANLEATVRHLADADEKLVLFALCGTNEKLPAKLAAIKSAPNVRIVAVPFTDRILEYIAASDLFCGKSGANSMAEPAFFGVPIMVTKCITYIERGIKNYYVKTVGGAMYVPSARRAAKTIRRLAADPALTARYRANLDKISGNYGAEAIADLIFERLSSLPVEGGDTE